MKQGQPSSSPRRMALQRLALAGLLAPGLGAPARATPAAAAGAPPLQAPNVVAISDRLVTAGQPTADALRQLRQLGFEAVIYLAPPTVSDAVPGEAEIVRSQGLEFFNIPIPFGEPAAAHVQAFFAEMARLGSRKRLVHCQVNMRASSLTFLHRVIAGREAPEQAYEAVARVWSPNRTWKRLIVAQLREAGIPFDPY